MSRSGTDCEVADNSDILGSNPTVKLIYSFDGNYAKGTIWLNSMIIIREGINNTMKQVAINRNIALSIRSNALLGGYSHNNINPPYNGLIILSRPFS